MKRSEDILQKIKAVKALADRGVDGEKETAAVMLERLLEKYGIDEESLESPRMHKRLIRYTKDQWPLLRQVVASVTGPLSDRYAPLSKSQTMYRFFLTDAEFMEIELKWSFYLRLYQEEQEILYKAFLMKHSLYTKGVVNDREMTPEEIELALRAARMAKGMSEKKFQKRLGNSE